MPPGPTDRATAMTSRACAWSRARGARAGAERRSGWSLSRGLLAGGVPSGHDVLNVEGRDGRRRSADRGRVHLRDPPVDVGQDLPDVLLRARRADPAERLVA